MKLIVLAILLLSLVVSCNINNSNYLSEIAEIENISEYEKFDSIDRMIDTMEEYSYYKPYRLNRSRIYWEGKIFQGVCSCKLTKDTLIVYSTMAFLSENSGYFIEIRNNSFNSYYKELEYSPSLKRFSAANLNQKLTLTSRPKFKEGEQITGLLTFITPLDRDETVKGKMYFTCIVKNS